MVYFFAAWVGVVFSFGLGSTSGFAYDDSGQEKSFSGTVSRSTDGDTIQFRKDGSPPHSKNWKIRMLGIDAPELHLPVKGRPPVGQHPWGGQAADHIQQMIPEGSRVTLTTFGTDVHGRYLGEVEAKSRSVNLEMVRSGWAIPYMICDGPFCDEHFFDRSSVDDFFKACRQARAYGRGIFSQKNPMTEMPFEFRLRMQGREPDKYVGDYETRKLYAPSQYQQVDVCQRIFFPNPDYAYRLGFEAVK